MRAGATIVRGKASTALALLVAMGALLLVPPGRADAADPATADSAMGIACLPVNGVRFCPGSMLNRVPSWDGVPPAAA